MKPALRFVDGRGPVKAHAVAWAGLSLLLAGAAPREPAVDAVLRIKLWMALFGIVILGIGLIFAVILGAGAVRRRARERYVPPSAVEQRRNTPSGHR